jgi:hypothetical protein
MTQRLGVGIGYDVLDPTEAGAHHPIDGVAAAAPNTHNLNASTHMHSVLDRQSGIVMRFGGETHSRVIGSVSQR